MGVSFGDMTVYTEAIKTGVFHVTPVGENTQLHKSIHLVTGVLSVAGITGGEKREETLHYIFVTKQTNQIFIIFVHFNSQVT